MRAARPLIRRCDNNVPSRDRCLDLVAEGTDVFEDRSGVRGVHLSSLPPRRQAFTSASLNETGLTLLPATGDGKA